MVMKSNQTLTSLDLGWTNLDFLFSRFSRDDGYYIYDHEFECSVEEWEKYRLDAFAIALLGSLVFPKSRGRIDTCQRYVRGSRPSSKKRRSYENHSAHDPGGDNEESFNMC